MCIPACIGTLAPLAPLAPAPARVHGRGVARLSLAGVIAVNEIPYMVQSSSTLSSNIPGQPRNTTTIGHRREGSVLVHHMGFGIQNGFYTLHAFLAAWLFSFL